MVYLLLLPVLVQIVQPHTTMRLRRGRLSSMRTILNIVSASCTSATVRLYSSSGIPAGATLNAQIKKGGSDSILITGSGSAPIGDYTVMHASYVVNGVITACAYSPTSFTLGCSGASITLSPYR